ncbi:hypothetical protein BaRGS_00008100 [Batillaria attramentaria]|uniref:Uncharacterized protein n=1 Tax=Batillaria attramentaria TaxID=370345 RepID=A0ABD0LLY9_9CAEN
MEPLRQKERTGLARMSWQHFDRAEKNVFMAWSVDKSVLPLHPCVTRGRDCFHNPLSKQPLLAGNECGRVLGPHNLERVPRIGRRMMAHTPTSWRVQLEREMDMKCLETDHRSESCQADVKGVPISRWTGPGPPFRMKRQLFSQRRVEWSAFNRRYTSNFRRG